MERRFEGGDADDGVGAALARRPVELPDVEAAREADAAADAVGALRHRMPVERQRVVLFDEDVERPVLAVPRVFQLHLPVHDAISRLLFFSLARPRDVPGGRRHVEQGLEPRRFGEIVRNVMSRIRRLGSAQRRVTTFAARETCNGKFIHSFIHSFISGSWDRIFFLNYL